MGTGEEKTIMEFPEGYGYRYKASDHWVLNHMIHNLTSKEMKLDIQYTIDFIPDTAPEAANMTGVRPIWMDVQNGSNYPVFDVHRGSGGKDGKFTYPRDAKDPYHGGPPEERLDRGPRRRPDQHRRARPHRRPLHRPLAEPFGRQVRRAEVQHQAPGSSPARLLGEGPAGQGRHRAPVPLTRQVLRAGRARSPGTSA